VLYVDSNRLRFNIVSLQAAAILRLRGEERDLILIHHPYIHERVKPILEGHYENGDKYEGPYRFRKDEPVILPDGVSRPVWISPVPIPA